VSTGEFPRPRRVGFHDGGLLNRQDALLPEDGAGSASVLHGHEIGMRAVRSIPGELEHLGSERGEDSRGP
jgi:hypothetical protein